MNNMGHDLGMCEAIIVKAADYWSKKLPSGSVYSREDFISEGWLIYMDCLGRNSTAKLTTYLQKSIHRRFYRILAKEANRFGPQELKPDITKNYCHYPLRGRVKTGAREGRIFEGQKHINPERLVMLNEAIEAIAEVSADFALMITDGASKEFLAFARRHMRAKRFRRGISTTGGNILFTKELIEIFFGVRVKDLKRLVSNYL